MEQLIQKNSKGPVIDGVVVVLLKDHLGGHVLIGSTKSFPLHLDVVSSPAQIAYLDVAGIIEQNVFGLNG